MPVPSIGEKHEIIVRIAAINLTGLLYAVVILQVFGLSSSAYKFAVFACILVALPIVSAAITEMIDRFSEEAISLVDIANKLIVLVAGGSLAVLSVFVWMFSVGVPSSNLAMRFGLSVLVCLHGGMLAAAFCVSPARRSRLLAVLSNILACGGRFPPLLAFVVILLVMMMMAFYVGQGIPLWNVSFGWISGLNPKPHWASLLLAPIAAIVVLAVCFRLVIREQKYESSARREMLPVGRFALILAVVGVAYFYFDFKFDTDVLHFLTNVGPASQIVYAESVPMVTAFSQYGPGPLILTWLTFLTWPPSFHAANILSQLHSIAFYSVVLICLYRMTPYRMSALWLGFFAVGVLMAGWWGGNGSLNGVPSSMGMRYLPNGILVLAISCLPEGRKLSASILLAVLLSALWSFETLAGTVAILGMFLLMHSVRHRDIAGFFGGLFFGIVAPIAAALLLISCTSFWWAGKWPDYLAYLQFALVYNMTSEFWSLDASGAFLGWIPVATAVMIALTLAWRSAIDAKDRRSALSSNMVIYRFAPMAALTGFMSSYFAGRSVDFTLIIAFLPLCAIVIPPLLAMFGDALSGKAASVQLAALPLLIVFIALTFSFNALYREGAPYSTALSECLYNRNCTPSSLASVAAQRYALRPMLDRAANPNYYDTSGLAEEAIAQIRRYAPDRRTIPLFLGIHPATIWSVHTSAVLVLAGKGHRWPISYVLSDEINPQLMQKITGADVRLEEGETVFIRSDEGRLGKLEAALVSKIRSGALLCPLTPPGGLVSVYRATFLPRCEKAA